MVRMRDNRGKTVVTADVPVYPSKGFVDSEDDVKAAGFKSLHDLVLQLNQKLIAEGGFPIAVGDYPTNKAKFTRIMQRARRIGLIKE